MDGFPTLAIVPLDRILPYETPADARVERVKSAISKDGILRNPLLVAPITGRFLLLDGTNRYTAFKELGIPHILAQVVDLEDSAIQLKSWAHELTASPAADAVILNQISQRHLTKSEVRPVSTQLPVLMAQPDFLFATMLEERLCWAYLYKAPLEERAVALMGLVMALKQAATLSRVSPDSAFLESPPVAGATSGRMVVFYPTFAKPQIIELASKGGRLPSGISRFVIPGRALGVDFPLSDLSSASSTEEKSEKLQALLDERRRMNRIRLYSESVYFFND